MKKAKNKKIIAGIFLLTLLNFAIFNAVKFTTVRAQEMQWITTINWVVQAGDVKALEIAQIMKEQLAQIGINVEIHSFDPATYYSRTYFTPALTFEEGGFDATFMGYSWMLTDYIWFIGCYTAEGIPPAGWNFWGWINSIADKYLHEAMSTYDMIKRKEAMHKWQEIHQEDVGTLIIGYPVYMQMTKKTIHGYDAMYRAYDAWNWSVEGYTRDDYVTITYGAHSLTGDPTGLLSFFVGTGYIELNVMYRGLFTLARAPDGTWTIEPDLAASYEISGDGLTLTIYLRKDVKWHDGVPFTSIDVKYTLETMLNPEVGAESFSDLSPVIESIEAPDNYTVVLHLKRPSPELLTYLASSYALIMPYHVLKDVPPKTLRTCDYNTKSPPPGLGPYICKEFIPGEYMILEAFKDFYRGEPFVDRLIFKIYKDPMTALAAFEAGEIDILDPYFSMDFPHEISRLKERGDLSITPNPYPRTLFIALNWRHPVLCNKYVRQAIAYMVPYDKIINEVYLGFVQRGNSPCHPLSWGYNPTAKWYEYNPERAKELMQKAGYRWPPPAPSAISLADYLTYVLIGFVPGLVVGFFVMFVVLRRKTR